MTHKEMQDKIKENLCFRCDVRYMPNHVCQNQNLNVLVRSPNEQDQVASPEVGGFDGEKSKILL